MYKEARMQKSGDSEKRARCSQPNSSVGIIKLDVWALLKWNTEDGDENHYQKAYVVRQYTHSIQLLHKHTCVSLTPAPTLKGVCVIFFNIIILNCTYFYI